MKIHQGDVLRPVREEWIMKMSSKPFNPKGGLLPNETPLLQFDNVAPKMMSICTPLPPDHMGVIPCQICMKILDPFKNVIFVSYYHN